MSSNITIFLMKNDGEFKFMKINPDYTKIVKLLGLDFNDDYIKDTYVMINGLRYTMYSKEGYPTKESKITATDIERKIFVLNTFILIRENKNHFFFDMNTSNMNDIKSRLKFPKDKKKRFTGEDYLFSKIILELD